MLPFLYQRNFKNIREEIPHSSQLEFLCFDNVQLKCSKKLIPLPKSLKKLHLLSTWSHRIPFELADTNITELKCTGVPWPSDLAKIYQNQFAERYTKYFTPKQLADLFKHFDRNKHGYIGDHELTQLAALIFKRFARLGYNGRWVIE